jgi:hypothetical protein
MSILQTVLSRHSIAKAFTKSFHDEVKRNIDDYEAKTPTDSKQKNKGVYNRHVSSSRYEITIPYIFATHESMVASFFENMPDLVISGRTAKEDKAIIIKAVYEYLLDKCDLDEFLGMSSWWFFLTGMVVSNQDFKSEPSHTAPQLDSSGQPMMDENGQTIEMPVYKYHDPKVEVENLLKIYFSPESEFTISGDKIPYYTKERLVEVDEIQDVYGVEVEPDEELNVDMDTKDARDSLKRANVKYYCGKLPSTDQDQLMNDFSIKWSFHQDYKVIVTKDKILAVEAVEEKPIKLARLYAKLNSFFGFGIGKTLRPFQEDMSVRRSQQLAYADRFAYPWLAVPQGTIVDAKAIKDYKKETPLSITGDKMPEYITPPQMPSVITDTDNATRGDAQFVSGTLDLSKGAQQTNTVKTATGQQLFAQSQDKRLNKARKSLAKYYREVVISLLKLARDNWTEEKRITYIDDNGVQQEMPITAEDLKGIDFDTDVDFNLDSVSVNKDIMSQRWISLLQESLNVPMANLEKIYGKVLKESFNINNPETYIQQPQDPNMPPEPPMGQPEESEPTQEPNEPMPAQPQTIGQQLAPQAPYVG